MFFVFRIGLAIQLIVNINIFLSQLFYCLNNKFNDKINANPNKQDSSQDTKTP